MIRYADYCNLISASERSRFVDALDWRGILKNYNWKGRNWKEHAAMRADLSKCIEKPIPSLASANLVMKSFEMEAFTEEDLQNTIMAHSLLPHRPPDCAPDIHIARTKPRPSIRGLLARRIAPKTKLLHIMHPSTWMIFDSFAGFGLQKIIRLLYPAPHRIPDYLHFGRPEGKSKFPDDAGFPSNGKIVDAFVCASYLCRIIAQDLNERIILPEPGRRWDLALVEMSAFTLGHKNTHGNLLHP